MQNERQNNLDKVSSLLSGIIVAEVGAKEVFNGKSVYLGGNRTHHWQVGAGVGILGGMIFQSAKNDSQKLVGEIIALFGLGIFLHDVDDFLKEVL